MFDRTLKSYVPKYYDGISEVDKFIEIEENLLGEFKSKVTNIKNNNYVITSDDTGLSYYEEILGLQKPNISGTDEYIRNLRINQIINKFSNQLPMTYRALKRQLEKFYGEEGIGFTISLDANNYRLIIIPLVNRSEIDRIVREYLTSVLPANLDWTVYNGSGTHESISIFTHGYLNSNVHDDETGYKHSDIRLGEVT